MEMKSPKTKAVEGGRQSKSFPELTKPQASWKRESTKSQNIFEQTRKIAK